MREVVVRHPKWDARGRSTAVIATPWFTFVRSRLYLSEGQRRFCVAAVEEMTMEPCFGA